MELFGEIVGQAEEIPAVESQRLQGVERIVGAKRFGGQTALAGERTP